jgi:hypothetical protein
MNSKPVNRAEQNQPMEDQQEGEKDGERNPDALPPFSFRLRIFLLIIFHEPFTLWTALERARDRGQKGQKQGAATRTRFVQA